MKDESRSSALRWSADGWAEAGRAVEGGRWKLGEGCARLRYQKDKNQLALASCGSCGEAGGVVAEVRGHRQQVRKRAHATRPSRTALCPRSDILLSFPSRPFRQRQRAACGGPRSTASSRASLTRVAHPISASTPRRSEGRRVSPALPTRSRGLLQRRRVRRFGLGKGACPRKIGGPAQLPGRRRATASGGRDRKSVV